MAPTRKSPELAGYLRISKSDDASTSLSKQRANITRVAASDFPGAPITFYEDDGVSGAKLTRKGLDALQADIPLRRFAAVYVDNQDRLTRDRGARVMWDLQAICEDAGTVVRGASAPIDLVSSTGVLTASMMAAAATFERERTSERIKATNAYLRTQGRRAAGGPAVWGLMRSPSGTFIPDPSRAPILRDLIDRLIAGTLGTRAVAEELTSRGIPTPRGGAAWSHRAIAKVLRSPALAGMTPHADDVLRGLDGMPLVSDDALLSYDRWRALQAALDARAGSRAPSTPSRELPLLHRLVVDEGGHPMYRNATAGRAERYVCAALGCPTHASISMAPLDAHVADDFLSTFGDSPETRTQLIDAGRDDARIAAVREQIAQTTASLASSRDPAQIADLASRLIALRESEDTALGTPTHGPIYGIVPTGRTIAQAWDAAPDLATRRAILARHVDAVVISPGPRGGRITPAAFAARVDVRWAS